MSLMTLPEELQQEILSYIGNERDLLHLALTGRHFCHRIIPLHLEFRTISGLFANEVPIKLWKRFMEFPSPSHHVRKILLGENTRHCEFRLPRTMGYWRQRKCYHKRIDLPANVWFQVDNTVYMVKALSGMKNLVEFRWTGTTLKVTTLLRLLSHVSPVVEHVQLARGAKYKIDLDRFIDIPVSMSTELLSAISLLITPTARF